MNDKPNEMKQNKKLFVVVAHGSFTQLKVSMRPAEVAGHYVLGLLKQSGTDEGSSLLGNNLNSSINGDKSPTSPATPSSPIALGNEEDFWKLLDDVKQSGIQSEDIYLYCEGNYLESGKPDFDSSAADFNFKAYEIIEKVRPGHVVTFSGTPGCQQFVNYWRECNQYPAMNLGDSFVVSGEILDAETLNGLPYWKKLAETKTLTIEPLPEILAVDKGKVGASMTALFKKLKKEAVINNVEEISKDVVESSVTNSVRLFHNRLSSIVRNPEGQDKEEREENMFSSSSKSSGKH